MLNKPLLSLFVLALLASGGTANSQSPQPAGAQPSQISWNRDDWNPQPQPDDVVLPLPCNGAVALRRVVTGPPRRADSSNYLEDRQVLLGGADDPLPYVGYLHTDFIAGGFYDASGQRYFLIGKYEVTVQQYDSVMSNGQCPQVAPDRASLPASNLSWFDAIEFTRRLNRWLYSEHPEALPKSAGQPGFVRLPTELEWEFAARGGLAVSDAERGNSTFVPAGGDLAEYVWFAAPESAAGQPRLIGSVKPNPLGLFDMLGNVEEIALDPFRLNRAGRLHGQYGGFVARGGSYLTSREAIRSSARTEYPLFSAEDKDELKLPTFGLRITVGATALSQASQAPAFKREWEDARRTETSVSGKTPIQLLESVLEHATPAQRSPLQAAVEQLNGETRKRNELQGRAIKSLLSAALAIRSNLAWTAEYLEQLHRIITIDGNKAGIQGELARQAKGRFDLQKENFDGYASVYADLIQQLGSDFRPEDLQAQAAGLKTDLSSRRRTADLPIVDAIVTDSAGYREGTMRDTTKILRSVVGVRNWR